jgi:hypothetical protein
VTLVHPDPLTRLVIAVNDFEKTVLDDFLRRHTDTYPVESVREGWHEARCAFWEPGEEQTCDWSTTGDENTVEDAVLGHVLDRHRPVVVGVSAMHRETIEALRALRDNPERHQDPMLAFQYEMGRRAIERLAEAHKVKLDG